MSGLCVLEFGMEPTTSTMGFQSCYVESLTKTLIETAGSREVLKELETASHGDLDRRAESIFFSVCV
jgi:hypothetical protein